MTMEPTTQGGGKVNPRNAAEAMTLRDFFAAHAPMPGAAEASTILGWTCRETASYPRMKDNAHTPEHEAAVRAYADLPSFAELWAKLSNEERFACCAKAQYMHADAMLIARESPSHT